jgi:hypothetical protein
MCNNDYSLYIYTKFVLRTPPYVHRRFQKHTHTHTRMHFTTSRTEPMITSHRIQTCAQEFSERILAHREFLSMPTFIACVPMSLKGASWKWARLCKQARSKTSRRTSFRHEISCCFFLSSSFRAFCLFVCLYVCVCVRVCVCLCVCVCRSALQILIC